jgi:hypothetical protein
VVFTGLLAVVAGLWMLSLVGVLDIDSADGAADGLLDDVLEPLNLAEVPSTVLLTIFALAGWFVSVLASVFLLDDRSGTALAILSIIVGVVGAVAGVLFTMWIGPVLGRVFETATAPSKRDLIGRIAEIRSATVTEHSGRAEAAWPDGTVSTIDVRVNEYVGLSAGELRRGDRAFIVEWIDDTDDFIVDRVPAELAE